MASLVLGIVGSAVGSAIGGTVLGLTAAQVGGFIGATIGQQIDGALFSRKETIRQEGPRLSDINLTTSTEGAPMPRVWGRARIGGQLIWAARFKERATTTAQTTGGGKGGGGSGTTVETTTYSYSLSFAVGLCEGALTRLGRVWADGKILDLSKFVTRFYPGTEIQEADPLIKQIEGADKVPAFRGLAYVVFEDLPLAKFGNRMPQLQFEVFRALNASDPSALDNVTQGVALIPGSGEFVLATSIVRAEDGFGGTQGQNKNNNLGLSDFEASLDQLEALLPNCRSVVLVVCWFGDDLRCGNCTVRPKVEIANKSTSPMTWRVNGITREGAAVVSLDGAGRPVFGGTPADQAVVEAILELKARGLAVHFYPFLLMDIPAGNTLPNPRSDNGAGVGQPAFPWRGRITCHPAAGYAGTVDKTAAAAAQADAFFGNATAANFSVSGTTVSWAGGTDFGYRRMVLHYALLCKAAGGVTSFLLGSELEGLTKIRSTATAYPTVTALKALAADAKAILGAGTKVSYAANWTEYANHRPDDGSGDVLFHLDPLWSDSNVDFVAIDSYFPSSDWRDGGAHLDYVEGRRIFDRDYLDLNVEGGEHFDWSYADEAARDAQQRTPIADPTYGESWVFRFKDLKSFWQSAHHDRPGGLRAASPTAWVPQSKPIWLTELGCPAVDRGSNQPNVFVDAKSSESALPYYSRGTRDDLIQRRTLEAVINHWDPANGQNPVSSVYGGRMIDTSRIHVWCWDARSFPDFPSRSTVWTDAPNWRLGHWLNGRVGLVMLADLVKDLAAYGGFSAIDAAGLSGLVTGFIVERTMSVREALEPLMLAFQFDAYESEGLVKLAHRGGAQARALNLDDLALAEGEPKPAFKLTRAQESELPLASRLGFIDASGDYRQSAVESRRLVGSAERTAVSQLPLVMEQSFAQSAGDCALMDAWAARERAGLALAPSALALDPSDIVTLEASGRSIRLRITEIADTDRRHIAAARTDPSVYELLSGPDSPQEPEPVTAFGKPYGVFLDLPLLTGTEAPHAPYFAAYATPWPGAVLLYRAAGAAGFSLDAMVRTPSRIGFTDGDFYSGPLWRFDRSNALYVTLIAGELSSKSELEVLNGANALAIENEESEWEIVQFTTAELLAPRAYKLTGLLRGQAGTEGAMRDPVPEGARVVVLDYSLVQPALSFDQRALTFTYRYGPAGEDFSDPAYVEETRAFAGLGLRPFSPVQVRGKRQTNGDWVLSWARRTRVGGDDWAQMDVPLGEESEAYDIEIYALDGTTLKRTLTSTAPSVTYAAAMQTSDFGAPQWNFRATVYQVSQAFGRGAGYLPYGARALIWHY